MQTKQNSEYIKATLPIDVDDGIRLDLNLARQFGEELAGQYCFSEPFPHIVIDNFLPKELIDILLREFPVERRSEDYFWEDNYGGYLKRQIFPENCGSEIRGIFNFFNSSPVLQFLEGLTSIEGLIGDPYFNGGGFHETYSGGKLGIHADFRIHDKLHLNRRLNLILYLNEDWLPQYGGDLELWDQGMKVKMKNVSPVLNRCVIFNTDGDSFHGHPEPLGAPKGITRKSIALYYYTASRKIYEDTPRHSTMFAARPQDSAHAKKGVAKLNFENFKRDWLPPMLIRLIAKIKSKLKGVV